MVGRAEIGDKPELLWEHPELERLYALLETEFEIRERLAALGTQARPRRAHRPDARRPDRRQALRSASSGTSSS